MRAYDVQQLINNKELLEQKISKFFEEKILFKQQVDEEEIQGHLLKAEHDRRSKGC